MITLVLSALGIIGGLGFIIWRTPWASSLPGAPLIEDWLKVDVAGDLEWPDAIEKTVFEGCQISSNDGQFFFEVMGSPPFPLRLDDSGSHWKVAQNVPEMLAMFGLQYAASCVRQHLVDGDNRWLDKFDKALDISESEARRCLARSFSPWTEHAASLRLLSTRYCLRILAKLVEKGEARDANLRRHRRVLGIHLAASRVSASHFLYDHVTNHGLITDNALLSRSGQRTPWVIS